MKLFIDTADREKLVVGIDNEKFETQAREEKSQRLLPFIEEILKKKGRSISDIKEIEVNLGPGSFTGIRVGLSVANALGFVLGVKVNGRDVAKDGPVDALYS